MPRRTRHASPISWRSPTRAAGVVDGEGGHKLLTFGSGGWQFPIPLQPVPGGWTFDSPPGKQAMTDRVVGRNELMAIGACADYVAAQKEYFAPFHDDEPVQQYARRLLSPEGRHDGLWWQPPPPPTDMSPLGDRIAASAIEAGKGPAAALLSWLRLSHPDARRARGARRRL